MIIPILFILLSAALQAGSAALIKQSTKMKKATPGSKKYMLVFAAGLFLYGPSFVLWASGLSSMNLAIAQPVFSGSMFLFTILASILLFRERFPKYKYLGFTAIIGGICILVL